MASDRTMKIILGIVLAPLILLLLVLIGFPVMMILCPITANCEGGCDYTFCYIALSVLVPIGFLLLLILLKRD